MSSKQRWAEPPAAEPVGRNDEKRRGGRILFGRRGGRPRRPGRRALLQRRLPELSIELEGIAPGELDPRRLFAGAVSDVWLEIGFGGGEHLADQLEAHPDIGILGAEPYLAGVARLLAHAEARGLGNLRIFVDDARLLLEALADASVGRLFTLFPDPWPKMRHRKRRLVSPETVSTATRVLKPGAEWRLATDDPDYARRMLQLLTDSPAFVWLAESADDWRRRPADWPETRYELKARAAGRRPVYLRFRRRDD